MRAHKTMTAVRLLNLACLVAACSDLARDNPVDPRVNGGLTLRQQLVGTWSRDEAQANELFTFKSDGRVELKSYSSPSGGAVDRNATFPQTRVRIYEGTFTLVGDQLEIFYTKASSNDPADPVTPPAAKRTVEITIRRNTLTLNEVGGRLYYNRYA